MDIDGDEDNFSPNYGNFMRHYYNNESSNQRHIYGVLNLPEKDRALFLVNKAISLIGHEYYLFDTPKFLSDIENNYFVSLKSDNPSWMCYFMITLAIGQQYLNETLTTDAPGIDYFNTALKLLPKDFEIPSVELIQTLLLFAFYQQGLNRSNTASCFYGQAIRLALISGIHLRSKSSDLVQREKNRRLWWTCYVMDSIWTAKLGQPIHVDSDDISVEIEPLIDLGDNFNNSILQYNCKLAFIISNVMKKVYKPTITKKVSDLLKVLNQLSEFQEQLPSTLKEQIISYNDRTSANLYLRLNQIVIITIRPLVLSIFSGQQNIVHTPSINEATKKCISAACSNISILEEIRKNGLLSNFGFWDARYLFSSLLILYMTGKSYSDLINLGRELNKKMAETGNFTAIENSIRFKELDLLFDKIKESNQDNHSLPAQIGSIVQRQDNLSPNTLLMNDITRTFGKYSEDETIDFFGQLNSLSKEIPQDLYNNLTSNLRTWDTFSM